MITLCLSVCATCGRRVRGDYEELCILCGESMCSTCHVDYDFTCDKCRQCIRSTPRAGGGGANLFRGTLPAAGRFLLRGVING